MHITMQLTRRDLALLILLTIFWGLNWPVMKLGVHDYPPLLFRAISMTGGIAVIGFMALNAGLSLKVPQRAWPRLILLTIPNMVLWHLLIMYGVKLLSSGRAAILGYTMPAWAALWGLLLFRERIGALVWIGMACALAGALLLVSGELAAMAGRPLGTLLMLAAAASWGLGSQLMKRRQIDMPVLSMLFWMLLLTLPCMVAASLALETASRWPNGIEWTAILYNAFITIGLCHTIWIHLARALPPVVLSLSMMPIPVIGVFSGMALLGETPRWQDYAAIVLILMALGSVLPGPRDGKA